MLITANSISSRKGAFPFHDIAFHLHHSRLKLVLRPPSPITGRPLTTSAPRAFRGSIVLCAPNEIDIADLMDGLARTAPVRVTTPLNPGSPPSAGLALT